MARRRRKLGRPIDIKGRSTRVEQYAPLSYELLRSAAWRSLSGPAVKVFLELRTRFHGANNGRLSLSLEQASRLLGLGKATVQRALLELQEKGFIILTRRGQWYGRLASTWAVTDRPMDGMTATQPWKSWRPAPKSPKTNLGSRMDPSVAAIGAEMDRERADGSATEPVRALRLVAIGSGMGR